ncbi:hypothetical protein PILCRDRAFT_77717 [Piloderma croceum F 1598]|uniref:FAD-binding domain-containing protein n=1 Tax=Piloderma croceum (strain F 1598) TaxID=765440 RepID=A0A0C3EVB5_PILCF|nr:hypothetical protein PILCRDRAFT_77717 [Piloderma croceum F 1598]
MESFITKPQSLQQCPVLIIGAGMVGLTLAQTLKKNSIPFLIFERDSSSKVRTQGWALTIHTALSEFQSLLPESLNARLDSTKVNSGDEDAGDFPFLDLSNCDVKWRMPPAKRKRVSRDRLRQLLLEEDIEKEVLWNKLLTSVAPTAAGVKAFFNDGSSYEGLLLVGIDGASSTVRTFICPSDALARNSLPVNFLGTSLEVTKSPIIESLLEIHPVLIHGCHHESSTYVAFSAIDSPETNGTISRPVEEQIWRVQVGLSWLYTVDDGEVPSTDAERIVIMRERSANFDPRLKSIFYDMLPSDHSPIRRIKVEDWCPPCDRCDSFDGRITLAGDAAHTMTTYRGEGFNHGVLDVFALLPGLQRIYKSSASNADISQVRKDVISEYEEQSRVRGREAVLLSREACLKAHQW